MNAKYVRHEWEKDGDLHVACAVGEVNNRKFWATVYFTPEMMEDDNIDKLEYIKSAVEEYTEEDVKALPTSKLATTG